MYLYFDFSFYRLLQGCFSHNLCLWKICDWGMLALSRGLSPIGGGESGLLGRLRRHLRLRRGLPRETGILFTRGNLQYGVTNAKVKVDGWCGVMDQFVWITPEYGGLKIVKSMILLLAALLLYTLQFGVPRKSNNKVNKFSLHQFCQSRHLLALLRQNWPMVVRLSPR